MKKTFGILAIVACAGVASASTSFTPAPTIVDTVTFTNISSNEGSGNAANTRATWGNIGTGSVDQIRVVGSLTSNFSGTYASEALVRISPFVSGEFPTAIVQGSTTDFYSGTIAVDRTVNVTPFNLGSGGVAFEWFESYNDGAGADSTWDSVTYEFIQSGGPAVVTNGNFNLGAISTVATHSGSHVAGGLDFFTFSIGAVANPGESLSISMTAGLTGTSMTDTEIALYNGEGDLIGTNDDIGNPNFFSILNFNHLASLDAGTYTLVTGGYNTLFPSTLDGTFSPGTNAGTYELAITYVPTPGALALLGIGGLIANRRRR